MLMRLRALTVLVAIMGLSAGLMVGAGQAATERHARVAVTFDVSITEFMFTPNRLQVHVGDVVKWTNNGGVSHTTQAKNNVWNSGVLAPGASFSFTFANTGLFRYRCAIHPTLMTGTIKAIP
jgi:plastocyanin